MNVNAKLIDLEERVAAHQRREVHKFAPESPADLLAFRRYRDNFVVIVHRPEIDTPRDEVRQSVSRWAENLFETVSNLRQMRGAELPRPSAEAIDAETDRILAIGDVEWASLKQNRGRGET